MSLGLLNLIYIGGFLIVFAVGELLSWTRGAGSTNTVSQLIEKNQQRSKVFAWVVLILMTDLYVLAILHFETLKYLF